PNLVLCCSERAAAHSPIPILVDLLPLLKPVPSSTRPRARKTPRRAKEANQGRRIRRRRRCPGLRRSLCRLLAADEHQPGRKEAEPWGRESQLLSHLLRSGWTSLTLSFPAHSATTGVVLSAELT
ncbi:hypothetical protein ZEAMMB73_Zm00001d042347, partial [Zea mays]